VVVWVEVSRYGRQIEVYIDNHRALWSLINPYGYWKIDNYALWMFVKYPFICIVKDRFKFIDIKVGHSWRYIPKTIYGRPS